MFCGGLTCASACYLQNALWRKQMGSRVQNLQFLSDETVRGLLESLQLQEVLEQQQKRLLDNQERISQQGQEVCPRLLTYLHPLIFSIVHS